MSNVLLGVDIDDLDLGSDLGSTLFLGFGLTLLFSYLGVDQRLLSLGGELHVNDLESRTGDEATVPELLIYGQSNLLTGNLSVCPELVVFELSNDISGFGVGPGDELSLVVLLVSGVEVSNLFALKLVLDAKAKGDILTSVILNLDEWWSLRSWIVSPVDVDQGGWESDEALGWTNKVPTSGLDIIFINLLSDGIVLDTVFDWFDGSHTHEH